MKFTSLIQKCPSLFSTYWNNKWSKGTIMYRMETGKDAVDVRTIFSTKINPLILGVGTALRKQAITDDATALACLRYVVEHVSYEADVERYGKTEMWQRSETTFKLKTGDCEDMSILLMDIMRAAGILSWRCKIVCGEARDALRNLVGHAYVIYLTDEFKWTALDAAYYPIQSIANFGVPQGQVQNYGKIWFTFNWENSWHQKSTTIFLY